MATTINPAIARRLPPLSRSIRSKSTQSNPNEVHIGKQLSRIPNRVLTNHKTWSNLVKKFPKTNWNKITPHALSTYNRASYEFDGLANIHKRSYDANVLLEIRDARVPASSHHPSFTRLAKHRTHLIAYTHADLLDVSTRDKVESWTNAIWPHSRSIFVDTRYENRSNDTLHHYDPMLDGLLHTIHTSSQNFALTVGVPNVGKSSVLMSLLRRAKQREFIPKNSTKTRIDPKKSGCRKGHIPEVEDVPGKTREITEYLLRDKPRAFFMDVPGITPPYYMFEERPEAWFGLGAANLLPLSKEAMNNVSVQKQFCSYVLHCANRDGLFHYVDKLQLDGPTDDIEECLMRLANRYKDKFTEERLMLKRCETFLKLYNTGNFGPLVLDDVSDYGWRPFDSRDESLGKERVHHHHKRSDNKEVGRGVRQMTKDGGRKQREVDEWFSDYTDFEKDPGRYGKHHYDQRSKRGKDIMPSRGQRQRRLKV